MRNKAQLRTNVEPEKSAKIPVFPGVFGGAAGVD
jgi:hypothetical protein